MHARTPLWDRPAGPARVNEPCLVSTSSLPHSVSVATIYSPVASDNHLGVTCSTAQFSPDRTLMRWDEKNIIIELRWSWKKLNRVLRDVYVYVYLYVHSYRHVRHALFTHIIMKQCDFLMQIRLKTSTFHMLIKKCVKNNFVLYKRNLAFNGLSVTLTLLVALLEQVPKPSGS